MPKGGQNAKCTEAEFIRLWDAYKNASELAKHLNVGVRQIFERRRRIEQRLGIKLDVKAGVTNGGKFELTIDNGVVIVFSDAHYYPGEPTTAHKGLIALIKRLKPKAIIANGDVCDFSGPSKHPRIGWDNKPSIKQELEVVTDRLEEIVQAAPKGAYFVWPLGNHDARFETYLAANAPQYQHINGFSLKDHFPRWKPCWSCWINNDVVVKHRYKGGIHATHNNTLTAGKTMVTGHLHSLKVTPYTDYAGTRFGVDCGTLSGGTCFDEQFSDYLEHNPVNWRAGFAVLTFKDSKLLMPELCQVWDEEHVQFRGELIKV